MWLVECIAYSFCWVARREQIDVSFAPSPIKLILGRLLKNWRSTPNCSFVTQFVATRPAHRLQERIESYVLRTYTKLPPNLDVRMFFDNLVFYNTPK